MITVIAIFSIIFTLIAGELYAVYSSYREDIKEKNEALKKLNYSSR